MSFVLFHVRNTGLTRESRNEAIAACETASIPGYLGHDDNWPFREAIELKNGSQDLQRIVSF